MRARREVRGPKSQTLFLARGDVNGAQQDPVSSRLAFVPPAERGRGHRRAMSSSDVKARAERGRIVGRRKG